MLFLGAMQARSFMQIHPQSQSDKPSTEQSNNTYQRQIPWRHRLDPTSITQLGIPPISTLPLGPVDVVVLGAGVARLKVEAYWRGGAGPPPLLHGAGGLRYELTGPHTARVYLCN